MQNAIHANRAIAYEIDQENERLVSAALGGDYSAFSRLCELHSAHLLRTISRITRNNEDAEDALQDTFMRAFIHRNSFDGRAQFVTWMTRIAINSALMLLRKRRRHVMVSIDGGFEEEDRFLPSELADDADDPECLLLKSETNEWLRRGIGDLDHKLRIALEVWVAQGSSTKEGARRLNISTAAFKARITRAKAALKAEYARQGRTLRKKIA
jgi:RNA polymerase sigma-70 factor (ECF subfamily)